MKQQVTLIADLTQAANEKREALVAASKEKEILIKLKDKKFEKYQFHLSQEEQKFLDEIASGRHIRSRQAI